MLCLTEDPNEPRFEDFRSKTRGIGSKKRKSYLRNPIQQNNKYEIQIGETMKLLEQIFWYEGDHGVLGRLDLVSRVSSVRMRLTLRIWH